MPFVWNCSANAPASSHQQPISCYPFFISNETHYMDTCGLPFPLGGGLRDGGAAALPAFNRDALTNRPRISLLDKVSFILTLHVPQRLCMEIKRAGESKFLGCVWGRTAGILYLDVLCLIMPEPSACTHTTHTHIPWGWIFPQLLAGDSSAYFSQQSHTVTLIAEKWRSMLTPVCPCAVR